MSMNFGIKKSAYPNGQLKKMASYQSGTLNGLSRGYFESGKIRFEEEFENGLHHGHCRHWHENGQLHCQGLFFNGKRYGLWRWWHSNGVLAQAAVFFDGKKNGCGIAVYPNSKISGIMFWKNDLPHGMAMQWKVTGDFEGAQFYDQGSILGLETDLLLLTVEDHLSFMLFNARKIIGAANVCLNHFK